MARVSVIVPVYNTKKYLEKCLDSLVNQTLDEIEIVIIDDGSTDGSIDILRKYSEKYTNKIKLISKENGGQGAARIIGIKDCCGEYIGFLDSDDYADINMYKDMYETAVKDDLDLVECRYKYIREETNEELKPYGYVRPYKNQKDMFKNPLVSPWNKLVKADILKKFEHVFPEGLIYEDTSFFVKMIPNIRKSGFVDKEYIYHILRGTSTMNANKNKRVGNIFPVLEDVISYYKDNNLFESYHQELEIFCSRILLCSSMQRIAMVSDKKLQKEFVNETFEMLKKYFPKYKKNSYLGNGGKDIYMKFTNKIFTPLFLAVFKKMGE